MPKLSLIESEAARLVGRIPEARRRTLQQALIDLCEAHWPETRGPEPATPLAHALWSTTPPCAYLLADLFAADEALERLRGKLGETGVHFLGVDDDRIRFEVRGHAHPPVDTRQLGEMPAEIRRPWRG